MNVKSVLQFIRNFLFAIVNREFLIFVFFLALSGVFWLIMALNETYESEVQMPLRLVNIPRDVVITTEMEDTIIVSVRDKGYALATYLYSDRLHPINVNFNSYANRNTGVGHVPLSDIQRAVYQQLFNSSKIAAVKTDKVDFTFNYGVSKKLPIKIVGKVVPSRSYYLARTKFEPQTVTVYASKEMLDSMHYVATDWVNIVNFDDTITHILSIKPVRGVKVVPNSVRATFYPDILTEEAVEVPITAVNMPPGKVLRTFPSKIKVRFTVGASRVRSIHPDQFMVIADYRDLAARPSDKCSLMLHIQPRGIKNARLEFSQVDYLIEQQ